MMTDMFKKVKALQEKRDRDNRERNVTEAIIGNKSGSVYAPTPHWIHARVWDARTGQYAEAVLVEVPEEFHDVPFYLDQRIEIEGWGPERLFRRKMGGG